MKRVLTTLTALIILVCVCLTGCDFVDDNLNGGGLNNSGLGGLGGSSGGFSSLTPVEEATGIEFNTLDSTERQELSLVSAIAEVERTSVAISIGSGAGSGVIIDVKDKAETDVYIITCHHVISSGGDIAVYLPDENCSYENQDYIFTGEINNSIYTDNAVTLVGGDRVSDIAVLKIDLNKEAESGNKLSSDKIVRAVVPNEDYQVRKGESIFAIGNPSGVLPGSVATGIISFLERDVVVGEVGNMRLMQIGVSTNPGNSGGGLYNLYGELIGITNAGNTNYAETNFAIPCNLDNGNGFINISKHLIKSCTQTNYGKVPNRWNIGINVDKIVSQNVDYVRITNVEYFSNAYQKLKVGDIINSLTWNNGKTVTYKIEADGINFASAYSSFIHYSALMRTELEKGDSFIVNVSRSGYSTTLNVAIDISVADFIFCDTGN